MDIGDQRYANALLDGRQCLQVPRLRHRHADDFATGVGQVLDLGDSRVDVPGLGVGHRLHGQRVLAADNQIADRHFAGGTA